LLPLEYFALAPRHQREEIVMSVVVSAVAQGLDAQSYEAVTARVMPGDQLPDGCQLHIAGPVEQGWRVITVWESPEAFDRFPLVPEVSARTDPRFGRARMAPPGAILVPPI
jgi:hypothetical protein